MVFYFEYEETLKANVNLDFLGLPVISRGDTIQGDRGIMETGHDTDCIQLEHQGSALTTKPQLGSDGIWLFIDLEKESKRLKIWKRSSSFCS